ncbi:MAG: ATP synthase F1 subunit epsilon [Patescibacteria group bacterium]|jgi:F-type H+-transporting ATPase subunit epsilon
MADLTLKIVTPERLVFEGMADSISAMTEMGEVTILPGHAPLVALLRAGEMRLKTKNASSLLSVSTGLLEVRTDNIVIILADTAERAEELDVQKIEEAKALAQKRLLEARSQGEVAYADAASHLERELARERVARKGKYRDVGKARP